MKVYYFIIPLLFFFFSCNNKKPNNKVSKDNDTSVRHDTLPIPSNPDGATPMAVRDTTIIFSIEGLSSEGSEVKARYISGKIRDAEWSIFGETGQSTISYIFLENGTVKASEKNYTYKTDLTEVNNEKDMNLKSSLQYILDTNGRLLSKINDTDFVDVFTDFKKNVPLNLSP